MNKDLYYILGVEPTANEETIRRAYHTCVRMYHPDHNPHADARDRLSEVILAYRVLSQPKTRAVYNQQTWQQPLGRCGYDVTYEVVISPAEAMSGAHRSLTFWTPQGEPYQVDVPIAPGTYTGSRLTINGKGGPSVDGQARGDLIVVVKVK